jgi:hypothetical protein
MNWRGRYSGWQSIKSIGFRFGVAVGYYDLPLPDGRALFRLGLDPGAVYEPLPSARILPQGIVMA